MNIIKAITLNSQTFMISMIIATIAVAIIPIKKQTPKSPEFLESDEDEKLTEKKSQINQKTKKHKQHHQKKPIHFKSDNDSSDDQYTKKELPENNDKLFYQIYNNIGHNLE